MSTPEALSNVPQNLNFMSPLGFKLHIRRTPHVNYFLHKVNLPGLDLPMPVQHTPFVDIPYEGDHVKFNELSATFHVDERLNNWLEIHSWMRNIGKADDFMEHKALHDKLPHSGLAIKSEIVLTLLNSAKDPYMHVTFHDCMPTTLSDVVFDATMPDVKYLTADVKFIYSNFDYERIVK
jgi:hypothetical protein